MKTKNYSNKMLLFILTILILLCISYLYLKNKNENKEIESFVDYNIVPQSTQQSLSVYTVNQMDSDTRGINYDNTKFNSSGKTQDSRAYNWNGYWISSDNKYYLSSLQINDILILSINIINVSNSSPYNSITQNSNNTFTATTSTSNSNPYTTTMNCPLNNFTALCQLNFDRTKFYIKSTNTLTNNIYCNTIGTLNNTIAGYIDGNKITISYSNTNSKLKNTVIFNKDTTMNNSYNNSSSTYSLTESNLINPYPQLPASNVTYNSLNTSYNNKNTFMPINTLSQYITTNNNNSYKLCSLINNINNNNKTLAYIFYINDFINIQSLDYNFWGIGKNDSNLALKNTNLAYSLALKIKKYMKDYTGDPYDYAKQISSYMYCGDSNYKDLNFTQETNNLKNNFNNNKNNNSSNKKTPVVPIVWTISSTYNTSTCYISLAAAPDKNNTVKYPVFNSDGSINMSINDGGTNQELIFEDITTIKNESNYFISTGYFRTNDLLYMVSNNTNKTLQGDNSVKLVSKPSPNGKWVIIGFNDNANINNAINSSF
jgi:hypothetical protein